jgi:YVTN family beta-propeller protein
VADTSQSSTEGDLPAQGEDAKPSQRGSVLTFLIADVRGYTRFTQEHGDEEAGRLAAIFAELARETVLSCGGELIELRGDEALCVFGSARQALRAAVELQTRFRRRTDDGPAFPLPIGIGLDAGEAVPIEGGYRGGALNTAARLCSMARPGEILATDTVVSLARRLEGIRFVARRPVRLKGLEDPVRVIEVVPEAGLPPLPEVAAKKRPLVNRRRLVIAAAAGVALVAALVALVVVRSTGRSFLAALAPNAIGVIDADAGGIESQVKLDSGPSAITTGGGFLWVASDADGTVSRLDPESRTVQTLTLGGSPGGVAYGAGSLWVTKSDERALVQINPKTTAVVQTITVGNGPGSVAIGKDAVWVVNTIDGTISRIELARGSVTDTIPVGPNLTGIAVGAGAVWVASEGNGTVVRIDPALRTIVQGINVGNDPTSIAVGDGGVWVANNRDGTVSDIDPDTNSVSATIRVGGNPSAVAADLEAVWVGNSGDGTITRIDPDTGRITGTVALGSSPSALTLADGKLWATTLPSLGGHRGGMLRVESAPSACRCVDPVQWPEGFSIPPLLYDGLVAYRYVAGTAGARLVPDLAARLPTPTDEGKTYSFQLRPGIRYSSGKPVRASDFRFSLERLLTIQTALPIYAGVVDAYAGVVGAAKCARAGKRCDLSQGIKTDDGTRTITIRLTEPDPEFLYKLALPLASLVPDGTPLHGARAHPIPGTGPYRIATFDPDREIRLVRNEHFRVWSPDARPDGYPDEIRVHLSKHGEARLVAVEKGTADWVSLVDPSFSPEQQRGVLTRYADRFHSDPLPGSFWLFLNTRVPPFDDLRVRRALNFATDRETLVELAGGLPRETCQILPPSFPAYRPYCPYTRNPNAAGTWTAPDLAKARALVAASGTAGMRVQVVGPTDLVALKVARYFVSLLRQLGYRSSLRVFPRFEEFVAYVGDSRNRAQLGPMGWFPDILAASNFLQPLFTCASIVPKNPSNQNLFQHCDPRLDAKMKKAAALQVSDPVRANDLWTEVDRALVDRAVALPWGSPRNRILVSERVGNYQSHPLWGTLLDQLWVK